MSTKNCAYWAHYISLYLPVYSAICHITYKTYNILYIYHITTFVGLFRGQKLKEDLVTPPGSIPNSSAARSGAQNARKIHYQCVLIDGDQLSPRVQLMIHEKTWLTHSFFLVMRLSCHLRIKQHTETQTQTHRLIPSTFSGQHFMSHIPGLSRYL